MWPSNGTNKSAVNQLIGKITKLIFKEPDKWKYLDGWYKFDDQGPFINGQGDLSIGINKNKKWSKNDGPGLTLNRRQLKRVKNLFQELAALKGARNMSEDEK